ncbi:cytochrome P450 [Biscogniauxia mediterranea]|nr:cytochrome P450 [Biscogniauxia mediterranea]
MSLTITMLVLSPVAALITIIWRLVYNIYFHPLAKFPGPWYACATSLSLALISLRKTELEWLMGLVEKYGTESPIRITPYLLLFPNPKYLRDIYRDPEFNTKSDSYSSGALGPPSLFTITDPEKHRRLRKALVGSHWTIGALKKTWEPHLDELIELFIEKMTDHSQAGEEVEICQKLAEFAADFLTIIAFGESWGFVRNGRDERAFLQSWREGLPYFGFSGRWRTFRHYILKSPILSPYFLPSVSDKRGMGFLVSHAAQQISIREKKIAESDGEWKMDNPDFLQHCLDARFPDGSPLTYADKHAHITFLFQAGADTTGTALGCTLRYLLTHPSALQRARAEIHAADAARQLSRPVISYDESRRHLPYLGACVREALRLAPPAANQFSRVVPAGGRRIGGAFFVPAGANVVANQYVVGRDPALWAPDPHAFRPERWLDEDDDAATREARLEAVGFAFGMGARACAGRDIAGLELAKLLPEVLRNFDLELRDPGRFVCAGGVAYNEGLRVVLARRGGGVKSVD